MPRKSEVGEKRVRRSADPAPKTTAEDRARLRDAMKGPIDTSDIPERGAPFNRVERDAKGRLPPRTPRPSPIRSAIIDQLAQRKMNRNQLVKEAKGYCPSISQSAVYEFIAGRRDIQLNYAEALMQALGLRVTARARPGGKRPTPPARD
jgi:hypothetical protein